MIAHVDVATFIFTRGQDKCQFAYSNGQGNVIITLYASEVGCVALFTISVNFNVFHERFTLNPYDGRTVFIRIEFKSRLGLADMNVERWR